MAKEKKKGQGAVEYLIIVGFVTFAVISVLLIAYIYAGGVRDKIKINQMEIFASNVIDSAESLFYSGEPSRATIVVYIPKGTTDITILGNEIILTMSTSSGTTIRAFTSTVPLEGTILSNEGAKTLTLIAQPNSVMIS